MIEQKENPDFSGPSTTVQNLRLFASPEITQLQAQISRCSSNSIVPNDRKIVSIVLENNGCMRSIDWFDNTLTKQRQARWINAEHGVIVDVFENDNNKIKISMHNLKEWISPSDSLMPRFAKSLAYKLQGAGASVRYKQEALSKYEKAEGDSDE
jgi:hypothetical protein